MLGPRTKPLTGALLVAVLALSLLPLVLSGCASRSADRPSAGKPLSGDDLQRADQIFAQMRQEHSLHLDAKALDLANELLERYPTYSRNDQVLGLAVISAQRLGDQRQALRFVDEFMKTQPGSPLTGQVLSRGTEAALELGNQSRAAYYLVAGYAVQESDFARQESLQELEAVLTELDTTGLRTLFESTRDSELWSLVGLRYVEAALSEGEVAEAQQAVASMQADGAGGPWYDEALMLVESPGLAQRVEGRAGAAQPNLIAVLCPVTGRFAVLGNAFYDGALLATKHVNAATDSSFQLLIEDTAAEPVTAAHAARRVCRDTGSIALIGPLMSAPAAVTAIVADQYGLPLISPTATDDRLWELGDAVFQTNLTDLFEARLLAQLACAVLLKERFAVLHPRTGEGQQAAKIFAEAVEEWGGEIVATADFAPEATDFREPIGAIKAARPEVVFVPATVDQTILLGPQLDFHQVNAMILGPSSWNAPKLIQRAGLVMQRAIFTSDLALFPAAWTSQFEIDWPAARYPAEATQLALHAYQATRLVLDTMVQTGVRQRHELADALRRRLSNQEIEVGGPEVFAGTIRLFEGDAVVPFPADRYAESWQLNEGAAADSLQTELVDPALESAIGEARSGASETGEPRTDPGVDSADAVDAEDDG